MNISSTQLCPVGHRKLPAMQFNWNASVTTSDRNIIQRAIPSLTDQSLNQLVQRPDSHAYCCFHATGKQGYKWDENGMQWDANAGKNRGVLIKTGSICHTPKTRGRFSTPCQVSSPLGAASETRASLVSQSFLETSPIYIISSSA